MEAGKVTNNNVVAASQENEQTFVNDLKIANNTTKTNVTLTIEKFKSNREVLNNFNTEILGGFVDRLPYTRIGELENHQVYSFIVAPSQFNDASETKPVMKEIRDNIEMNLMIAIVVFGVVAFAMAISILIISLRNKVIIKE